LCGTQGKLNFKKQQEDTMAEEERKDNRGKISRREFFKGTGGVIAGGVIATVVRGEGVKEVLAAEEVQKAKGYIVEVPEALAAEEIQKAKGHIVQVAREESACAGCGTCELACALVHGGSTGPSLRRIWVNRDGIALVHQVAACKQCDYPACYYACPLKDQALCIDPTTGARYIDPTKCTGCKKCIDACIADPPRINFDPVTKVALKCDLCKDRTAGPACVEFCQAQTLKLV
jgi:Fe-S-cluster-containing hydrogenase component 2